MNRTPSFYLRASYTASLCLCLMATPTWAQFRLPPVRNIPVPHYVPVPMPHVNPVGSTKAEGDGLFDGDWVGWVLGGVALLAVVGLVCLWRWWMTPIRAIRITSMPPGDAPEEVRRAWIGLELPLACGQTEPCNRMVEAICSNAVVGVRRGYTVVGTTAIQRLTIWNNVAADWWKTHVPEVMQADFVFLFPEENCELLDEASGLSVRCQ